MIKIRVLSFNGVPPAESLEAEFDELGGTIGRADTNLLALHDPDRYISRLQARIDWRAGAYQLSNLGGNPIDVDGRSLGNGETAPLRPGQRISIGRYVLEAAAGDSPTIVAEPPAAAAAAQADPLGLFDAGFGKPAMDDPFAEFLAEPAKLPAAQILPPEPAPASFVADTRKDVWAASQAVIPDDFCPFAEPMAPPPEQPPGDLGFGLQGDSLDGPGINTMFGLGPARRDPGADPFAGTPLSDQPGESSGGVAIPADPLEGLLGTPKLSAPPVADHVPEVRGSFRPPAAAPAGDTFLSWEGEGEQSAAAQQVAMPAQHSASQSRESTREAEVIPTTMFGVAPGRAGAVPERGVVESGRAEPSGAVDVEVLSQGGAPVSPLPVPASPAPPPSATPHGGDLMQAFLEGLGIANPGLPEHLDAELARRIGLLLREATQGTIELLLARALIKRELRAEVTMIVSRGNNPLKFSPNVEVALSHLLTPRGQGFLGPVEAMRDAYGDLRAHQFGFMAGMRAALGGVLQRFDPQTLEKRLSEPSMLDNLLPINRRARLWGLYTELYRDIVGEAEDDFEVLFGRAFLQAYEEQVRRMEADES